MRAAGRGDDDGWVGGGLNIGNWFADRQVHGSDRPIVEIELRHDKRLHSARPAPTEVPENGLEPQHFRCANRSIMISLLRLPNLAIGRPYAKRQKCRQVSEEESRAC